jgi:hypothetical protein
LASCDSQFRHLGASQDGAGFDEEQRAGLSQLDAAAHTVKQFRTMSCFQRRNRGADRGLGQIEHCRSARDVLTFSNVSGVCPVPCR